MKKMILLVGAPGSGKGTISAYLQKKYSLPTLSTGNIGRSEIQKGTELGKELDEILSKGLFFSDELAVNIAIVGLSEMKNGVILDGFPRNLNQAYIFDEYLKEQNRTLDLVLNVVNKDQNIIERLKDRRVCPMCNETYHLVNMPPKQEGICDHCETSLVQRDDDKEETIKKRLSIYKEVTEPLVTYYEPKGIVRMVSSDCSPKEMFKQVKDIMNSLK